jgi:aspartate aminotransferase
VSVLAVAARLATLEASPTLALAAKAKALLNEGKPVLDFTAGEPDFPTPASVKQAAIESINANQTRYTPASGIPELRAAIAAKLSRRLGVAYEPADVIVSCGAKHSLFNALQAVCQTGDEVLVFSPFWVSYPPLVSLSGAAPVLVATDERDGFQPTAAAIAKALSGRTKAMILNSPSNPTGAILDEAHVQALARVALDRRLAIITDEIYDELVYPPHQARSILQVEPKLRDQTIVVNGVSKTYSMTGWRIGYAAGPRPIMTAIDAFQSHVTSNPTSISQHAALAALRGDQHDLATMRRAFQERRDLLVNGLNALPRLSCFMPHGAFYAWCNVGRLGQAPADIAKRWLEELYVAVVPGEGFGSAQHVRFSFATSPEKISEALNRLKGWLK